jgi:hypothetical protein
VGPGPGCSLNVEPTDSDHQPHQKCNKHNNKKQDHSQYSIKTPKYTNVNDEINNVMK